MIAYWFCKLSNLVSSRAIKGYNKSNISINSKSSSFWLYKIIISMSYTQILNIIVEKVIILCSHKNIGQYVKEFNAYFIDSRVKIIEWISTKKSRLEIWINMMHKIELRQRVNSMNDEEFEKVTKDINSDDWNKVEIAYIKILCNNR